MPYQAYSADGGLGPIGTVLRGAGKGDTPVKLVVFRLSPPEVPDAVDSPFPNGRS